MPEAARHDIPVLWLRSLRAVIIVPIVEELFWRGWLMRWMITPDFRRVPLGSLLGGFVLDGRAAVRERTWPLLGRGLDGRNYVQWWMIRTKSLGDLILAHAVANACLSAYVIAAGKWEYWL